MQENASLMVDTIVQTLLHIGEHVVEINDEGVICRVWNRNGGPDAGPLACYSRKHVNDIKQEAIFNQCADKIATAFKTGKNTYLEQTCKTNNVSTSFGIRILPIHPEKNKLFLVAEHLADKAKGTDRTYAPEVLPAEQQSFHERVLNNISTDLVVLDADYRFLYVNYTAVNDAATRKWLIGKTDEEFFRHKNKPLNLSNRRRAMYDAAKNERQVVEWIEKTQTLLGGTRHMLRRIYPVFDKKGNLDLLIGHSMNVTDLVKAQEELKTSRDTFESAFQDSGIGMAMFSPEGEWLDANRVMCEMTGYPKAELLKVTKKAITHPDEVKENKELIKKMLRREISSYTLERRYISKQGKIVFVLFTLSLVWSKDEIPQFFIAQAVDITKRTELERVVMRKNSELEVAKINLVNKVNQLEELSYLVAHNLRGPAGNIKLLAEALLSKDGEDKPEGHLSNAFTVEEGLGFINEASSTLINSLGSLMKIAEVKLSKNMPVNECDVNQVVNDVLAQLQSVIFEKQASINLSLEVKILTYPRAYLESILYNFISNALKYNVPGVPPEINIATRHVGDKVRLSVKDNGLGIDMERYGDKMFKLNQVFHAGHDSKGFGLYLTKTQVESLGGSITVESQRNEGSEFAVLI